MPPAAFETGRTARKTASIAIRTPGNAMRLLLVNSNTSEFVTGKVAEAARAVAAQGTEIRAVTGTFGARIIGSRSENAIAMHSTMALVAEHAGDCDGVLIAVSYDTAVEAARELLPIPVLGMTEAALHVAVLAGRRVGVIVFGKRVLGLYRDTIAATGLGGCVAGWRALESAAPYAPGDQSEADRMIVEAAADLVAADGIEAIVLTGAVMAGVPRRLQSQVEVPMFDGITTGVPLLEALVRMKPARPRTGSYAPVGGRDSVGLSPTLAGKLKG
jgi:allantoin racemase